MSIMTEMVTSSIVTVRFSAVEAEYSAQVIGEKPLGLPPGGYRGWYSALLSSPVTSGSRLV